MKFDFVIGNPPYQDQSIGDNTKNPPIYNCFLDEAYKIANKVEMIHPARFLFDAGDTPKLWNKERLNDEHFKVMDYEPNCREIFPNTDIKGGIAITYRDSDKKYGAIKLFTAQSELKSIIDKVLPYVEKGNLSDIVFASTSYSFSKKMHIENPELINRFSKGHQYDIDSNAFERLEGTVIYDIKPEDNKKYIQLYGRLNNVRIYKWIREDYVDNHPNLRKWKTLVPKSNGSGHFGECLSTPEIIGPGIGHTRTFMSFGAFDSRIEAENVLKYIKTKFLRALLSVKKITQDNPRSVWIMIPMQDFSDESDIDWNECIGKIDAQLYQKYHFSKEDINFIETHVKEMV